MTSPTLDLDALEALRLAEVAASENYDQAKFARADEDGSLFDVRAVAYRDFNRELHEHAAELIALARRAQELEKPVRRLLELNKLISTRLEDSTHWSDQMRKDQRANVEERYQLQDTLNAALNGKES